jgi:hypothetical protein
MRSSTAVDAVAREPSPEERRVEMCLCFGGVKESWVVARRSERVLCLEKIAALLCDALSFNFPITSLSFFIESLFFWLLQCELSEIKL